MNKSLKIGCSAFPVKPGSKHTSKIYEVKCLRFIVEVEVSQCLLTYGENHERSFEGICSSEVDISPYLPAHGWGSDCHIDEGNAMAKAVELYCKEHNLSIVQCYNNVPSYRGAIRKN